MSFKTLRSSRFVFGLTTGLAAATLAACGGGSQEQLETLKIEMEMPKGSKDLGGVSLTGFSGDVPFLEYSRAFLVDRSLGDLADCGIVELSGQRQDIEEQRTIIVNSNNLVLVNCGFSIERVSDFDGLTKQIEKSIDVVYTEPGV